MEGQRGRREKGGREEGGRGGGEGCPFSIQREGRKLGKGKREREEGEGWKGREREREKGGRGIERGGKGV